ncbi:hypothetical protein HN748_05445, partial [Candidatus Peregrinibacteria bacterium]|nr:hypothetical protein [Candidatus Peregrinibacteria bacterium]
TISEHRPRSLRIPMIREAIFLSNSAGCLLGLDEMVGTRSTNPGGAFFNPP